MWAGKVGLGSKKVAKKKGKEIRARERGKKKEAKGVFIYVYVLCGVGWVPNCEEGM